MKKFFSKVALVATLVTCGMGLTSCDSLKNMNMSQTNLMNLASLLTTEQGASSASFSGTAKFQKDYMTSAGSWEYNPKTGVASKSNYAMSINVTGTTPIAQIIGSFKKQSSTAKSASITLGDITVGGVTYSNVQLTAVSYDNGNIGDVENAGYVYSCTYTTGGKTYTTPSDFSSTPYAYVDGKLNTSTGAVTLNVQLVLDASNQVEITYSGTKR